MMMASWPEIVVPAILTLPSTNLSSCLMRGPQSSSAEFSMKKAPESVVMTAISTICFWPRNGATSR